MHARRLGPWLVGIVLVGFLSLSAYLIWRGSRDTTRPIADVVSYLDRTFGGEPMGGIDEAGLWAPEISQGRGDPFRWTNGAAKFIVPIADQPPKSLHVHLGLTSARPVQLRIDVNGRTLLDEQVAMR